MKMNGKLFFLCMTMGDSKRKHRRWFRWTERLRRYELKTGNRFDDRDVMAALIVNGLVKPPKMPKHRRRYEIL